MFDSVLPFLSSWGGGLQLGGGWRYFRAISPVIPVLLDSHQLGKKGTPYFLGGRNWPYWAVLAWPNLLEGCSDSEHQQREPGAVQSLGLGTPHRSLGAEAVLLLLARDMLLLPGLLPSG